MKRVSEMVCGKHYIKSIKRSWIFLPSVLSSDFCWDQNPFGFCKNIILFLKKKLLQNPNGFWSQQKSLDNIKPLHAFPVVIQIYQLETELDISSAVLDE
jgi:hypothetical protein